MPVNVEPENAEAYLEGGLEEARELLDPAAAEYLEMYAVSKKVNNPSNDSPSIVRPMETGN